MSLRYKNANWWFDAWWSGIHEHFQRDLLLWEIPNRQQRAPVSWIWVWIKIGTMFSQQNLDLQIKNGEGYGSQCSLLDHTWPIGIALRSWAKWTIWRSQNRRMRRIWVSHRQHTRQSLGFVGYTTKMASSTWEKKAINYNRILDAKFVWITTPEGLNPREGFHPQRMASKPKMIFLRFGMGFMRFK